VQQFSFKHLDGIPTGELLARLTNEIYQLNLAVQMSVGLLLTSVFQTVIALILVYTNIPSLLWILSFITPGAGLVLGVVAIVL
jgi:ABC-type multidrug transport system fused ATPase/permease subunit